MSDQNSLVVAKADYKKELRNNNGAVNTIFKNQVIIKKEELVRLNFGHCVFEKLVSVENCTFYQNLNFTNCEFKKGLQVLGSSTKVLRIEESNLSYGEITISESDIRHLACKKTTAQRLLINSLKGGSDYRSYHFQDNEIEEFKLSTCVLDGKLTFQSNKLYKLSIEYSTLNQPSVLQGCRIGEFWIADSIVNNRFNLLDKDNIFQDFNIQSTQFKGRFDLGHKIEGQLYIHKTEFDEQVVLNQYLDCEIINLSDVYAKRQMSINVNNNINSLTVDDSSFDVSLEISGLNQSEMDFGKSLHLTIGGVIKGNLVINDCEIWMIDLNCINLGVILFNKIKSRWIIVKELHNLNKLILSQFLTSASDDALIIYDSNIGKTEFLNIDFSQFREVIVAKSNLSDVIFSNSTFPDSISLNSQNQTLGYKLENDETDYFNTYFRDNYRQLKLAMERQGNKRQSLVYKSKEMYYLRKEIRSFWDKVLLNLNFLSNKHGLSWGRGIIFTVIAVLPIYCMFHYFNQLPNDIRTFFKGYINFITTFPKLEVDSSLKNDWVNNLLIFLTRIVMGYGIYQTITAFRKYGGK